MRPLVLDTNIVLDLFVFADERTGPLRSALRAGVVRWIASPAMREELGRVLAYPKIATRLQVQGLEPAGVLADFDAHVQPVPPAAKGPATCADPDDQKFIDLAVQHAAVLVSKDRAVLTMRKRLQRIGVDVGPHWAPDPLTA
jgi:putative PIN family toxin of toxin-antitoxin system